MTESPDGRIAWITGASSGIGRALALQLAAEGWRVAISARSADDLVAVANSASSLAGALYSYPVDVTDRRAVAETVARIEQALGPIERAVLNAGTHRPVSAATLDSDDFRALIELNFLGTVHALEALLPGMRARRSGRVAIVASVAGYCGLPTAAAYGASKAALIAMAEALKPELDAEGVVLQIVNPGFVRTPLTDRNPFPMPFLMDVDDAAKALRCGLESVRFEIVFPRRMAWLLKALRCLPYPLFFRITRRLMPPR
jgi:short-subunit dehydrogenase